MGTPAHIGLISFPGVLQLDLTGPFGVFAAGPDARVDLVWKDTRPVVSSDGLILTPTLGMADCPQLDVLCIPGGGGVLSLMEDAELLDFLRQQAAAARFVASVCTGALVLGAAGLLLGRKATTHWLSFAILAEFGATPVKSRVVVDDRLITAAGVSSGIDMALTVAGLLWGESVAQRIQLNMEYEPEPPYASGSPHSAPPGVVRQLVEGSAGRQAERLKAARAAASRL
jgi:cyclohexyl-isocyanide hydratase